MEAFNKNQGFTLLELLLTLGLSAFIMSTAYLLFASEQHTYAGQQAIVQLQEVGRIATTLLRDRLRQAGGLGCARWHDQFPVFSKASTFPAGTPQHARDMIAGYHGSHHQWFPALPDELANRVRADTDVLVIHQAYEQSANLTQDMPNPQAALAVPNHVNLEMGDILMVADCQQADVFKISNLTRQNNQWFIDHHPPDNTSNQLSKAYTRTAQISVLQNAAYYIGDTGRHYANADPVYALYQFNGQHQELLEGVSGLRIWYGVDTNQDATVDTIMQWPPTLEQGMIHSVLLEIDTQSEQYHVQTWYVTATVR